MRANQSTYRVFCADNEQIPLFHQPDWLDLTCGSDSWRVSLYKKGDLIIGVLPYQISRFIGLPTIRQPRLCPYLGPLYFTSPDQSNPFKIEKQYNKVIAELLSSLPRSSFTRILSSDLIKNPLPFIWAGYKTEYSCTYTITKNSQPDALWNNIEPGTQRKIKHAQKTGLQVIEDSDIELFFNRHKNTYKAKGLKLNYDASLIRSIYNSYNPKGKCTLLSVIDFKGLWQASILLLFDAKQCYYLISARDMEQKNHAMFLLWWTAIQKYCMDYDFNFEGSLDRDIARVYRSFGADRIDLFNFSKGRLK